MSVRCSLLLAQPSPDLDAEAPKEPAVALPGCRAVTKNETLEDFARHCLTRKVQLPRLLPPRDFLSRTVALRICMRLPLGRAAWSLSAGQSRKAGQASVPRHAGAGGMTRGRVRNGGLRGLHSNSCRGWAAIGRLRKRSLLRVDSGP
jgi:hypothetical protein